jgi:hypothetical protein
MIVRIYTDFSYGGEEDLRVYLCAGKFAYVVREEAFIELGEYRKIGWSGTSLLYGEG